MSTLDHLGIGLWAMQSTAAAPENWTAAYRNFAEDAVLVEELGFHSVWTTEHRIWYDGWCPALIHAQAFAAARTTRLRFGSAMLLLPQHDPVRLARAASTLDRLSGGRLDLGVGLGHRDPEYDALGIRRDQRGRRMDAALDTLAAVWAGEHGDEPPVQRPGPPLWIGGMAPAAIARAARHNAGLMLPQTLRPEEMRAVTDGYRDAADVPGRVGALRHVWIEDDPRRAQAFKDSVRRHFTEEAGSWWILKGKVGFSQPEQLRRQLTRITETDVVGTAGQVAEQLNDLFAAGAEFLTLRVNFDFVERSALHEQLARLAEEVAPMLRVPETARAV